MTRIKTARRLTNLRQGRNSWYKISNTAAGAEVLLYDEIGWFGVTANDFARELQALDTDAITLRINSPGGDVFDGLAIYNALRNHPATVTTRIDGLAASAASFIAMAGDKIVAEKASQIMIHDAMGAAIGLDAAEMRDMADLLDKTSGTIAGIYGDRAGTPAADWRTAMQTETWYTADEALAAGLVDEVADGAKPTAAATDTWDLSIFNHQSRADAPAPTLPTKTPAVAAAPVNLADVFRMAMEEAAK
jgi:ATP-dependent protease ClpP protease subunit